MAIYSDPLAEASGNFLLTLAKASGNASGNFTEASGRFFAEIYLKWGSALGECP